MKRRRYSRAAYPGLSGKQRMALAEAVSRGAIRAGHVHSVRTLEALARRGLLKHAYSFTFQVTPEGYEVVYGTVAPRRGAEAEVNR